MANVEYALKFSAELKAVGEKYPQVVGSMLNDLRDIGYETVRDFTPVKTGKLRAGWEKDTRTEEEVSPRTLTNDVTYAVYVERGTSRMAPRLFAFRTVQYLESIVGEAYQRALARFGF